MQQLHPKLEAFYLSALAYAGMRYDEGYIKNIDPNLSEIRIDEKHLTLPYFDNLRNPAGRHIWHPLNESYSSPETVFLALYKKRLTLEINLKLSALIICLITLASDVQMQRKVKDPKLVSLLASIGEMEMSTVDHFLSMVKHSQKVNEEAFIVDLHVKKNGHIGEDHYTAVGKVNFTFYKELSRALEAKDDGYRVFEHKTRKKDIIALIGIFAALFDGIDGNTYMVGTNIKTFRYFNALLLASYRVTKPINDVAAMLTELKVTGLDAEYVISDLEWANHLEEVYDLTSEIRAIPIQTNSKLESQQLNVKEPVQAEPHQTLPHPTVPIPPSFDPSNIPTSRPNQPPPQQHHPHHPQQHQHQPPHPQQPAAGHPPQAEAPLSAEEVIRRSMQGQPAYPDPYQAGYYPPPQGGGYYPPQRGRAHPQPGYGYPPPYRGQPQGYYPPEPQPGYGYPPPGHAGYYPPPPGYPVGHPQAMGQYYPPQPGYPAAETPEQALRMMTGSPEGYSPGIPINPQIMGG